MSSKLGSQKLVIRFPPTNKAEASPSPAPSADASAMTEPETEPNDADGNHEGDDSASIDIEEEPQPASYMPTKRGRGRPRGRRGRGRGRGRGASAITIKLPKKDDGEEDDETEGDGVGEETDEMNLDGEEDNPKKVPVGGGRPFRRIHGQVYIIEGDELVTDNDPKGDEKIDKFGNLLGGRRFKATTFLLPNRHPERRYMLAIDAARTSGFRDSLYYFRRNPLAFKLSATQPEKDHLISEGKLGPHLKTRSVTLITARSAYKLHGSKTIVDGRWVTDDYYEDKALAAIAELGVKPGDPVGDLVDPNADTEGRSEKSLKSIINDREYGASGGGGSMYRPGGPTTIFAGNGFGPFYEPLNPVRKALLNRDGVTEENWMWMMASRAREADERWKKCRSGTISGAGTLAPVKKKRKVTFGPETGGPILPLGVYEPHTGTVFFRSDSQPTQSRLEQEPVYPSLNGVNKRPDSGILGGTKTGANAWGLAYVDTYMDLSSKEEQEKISSRRREKILKAVGLQHLNMAHDNIVANSGRSSMELGLGETEEEIAVVDVT
ncbi:chromatin remodelling complex Rsc7/Swp82 subunit-domain-containing protein [Lentinula detonsa]|uniref:Chromatin remodelling complex Rsc7/Swp82 subunit-domain-containing protein n=1 Tax=Lentinula detonsa TaxID=2804962 RepID=A0A9W8P4B7_9AGAR|nr:chromatin remodelling complex Rsc7/Swp82 subunit-domain-containing protein [Lentinula detonsa]